MTERYVPPAHQTATFDQAYAQANNVINHLVDGYLRTRAEDAATREVDIAGLAMWLQGFYENRVDLCELLAVAVVRLAEQPSDLGARGEA